MTPGEAPITAKYAQTSLTYSDTHRSVFTHFAHNRCLPSEAPIIALRNLGFAYKQQADTDAGEPAPPAATPPAPPAPPPPQVLRDINLNIQQGEVVVFLGPSGCGKTTLCRCITGVIPRVYKGTLTGEVSIAGTVITSDPSLKLGELARQTGLVLQEPDHQIVMTTVEDDLAFGPENLLQPPQQIRATVDALIGQVGLDGKARTSPTVLSGGEKQRLAIGGVLAMAPGIIVFDEPASGLDTGGRALFATIVKQLKARGVTVLVVEHDYEFLDFADRWVLMKDGRILADAAPATIAPELLEVELWR